MRPVVRVAWFRFRATFRHRLGGYLALVLLIGLIGGAAMGAVAAARRTQSSYSEFLASTKPSDLIVNLNEPGASVGYDAKLIDTIRHLPHVASVESYAELNAYPLNPDGTLNNVSVPVEGSADGLYFDMDRIAITQGRMPDPNRADEVVMSADVAAHFGLHVGSVVPWGFYANADATEPGLFEPNQVPHLRVDLKVVGVGLFNHAVVQDDIESENSMFVVFTPALTRQLTQCCTQNSGLALRLEGGAGDIAAVEAEITRAVPSPIQLSDTIPSTETAKTERAIKPESIALGVFGVIAALAALLIAAQVIGRQQLLGGDDLDALRALGASPAMTASDGLIGVVGSVVIGALLGLGVAVGLSPLAPIGPVRSLYPSRGIAFDWTVLGLGMLTLIFVLSGTAFVLATTAARRSRSRRSRSMTPRQSRVARLAAGAGPSAPTVVGIRFALEPGRGRNTVPVRSAIFGATLAVVVIVSTIIFGASFHALVSRPALYGWNWDYELSGGGGVGAVPEQRSAELLKADTDVAEWSGVYFWGAELDGQTVHVIGASLNAPVAPPLLSGHGLEADDEIVLGATTLARLHKHVGDTVDVSIDSPAPTKLRIVGTATMPTVGFSGFHSTMGEGALLPYSLISVADRNAVGNVPTGPEAIFVRLRAGTDRAKALKALNQIATSLTLPTNYGVEVQSVLRPAEIVNFRSMTSMPLILGVALAIGATAALAFTLVASVRRRRRDLALLKTLGFTRRQLAAAVAWQSTVAVGIGVAIGVPVGWIVGRSLWDLFANEIHAVPEPIVPTMTIALIAIGSLLLANAVAAIPAQNAGRTSATLLLRGE
ncbi:MAG: ABC transporter permease [Ilumatobacteraceae bacterium]